MMDCSAPLILTVWVANLPLTRAHLASLLNIIIVIVVIGGSVNILFGMGAVFTWFSKPTDITWYKLRRLTLVLVPVSLLLCLLKYPFTNYN